MTISLSAGIFAQEAVNRLSDSSASATETAPQDLGSRATAESFYLAHANLGNKPHSINDPSAELTPSLSTTESLATTEIANAMPAMPAARPSDLRANDLPTFDQVAIDETPATVNPTQPSLNRVADAASSETHVSTTPTSVIDVSTAWNQPPTITPPVRNDDRPTRQDPELPVAPRQQEVPQLPPPSSIAAPPSRATLPAPGGHPNDYPISRAPTYHSQHRSSAAELVQQNAAMRAAQRAGRIEARKWAGYSPLRPPAQPIPFMSGPVRNPSTVIIVPFADRRLHTTQR